MPIDISKPYFYSILIMKASLLLPFGVNFYQKAVYYFLFVILRMLTILSGIGTLILIIIILKNNADMDISESLADILGLAGCNFMGIAFFYYQNDWTDLVKEVLNFEYFGVPPSYKRTVKKMFLMSTALYAYTSPCTVWYSLTNYLMYDECEADNIRTGMNVACGLLNPTWLPLERLTNRQFWIFFVLQFIGIMAYVPSSLALCMFIWETVELVVCKVDHLNILFENMFESDRSQICSRNLKYCLKYHQNTLRIAQKLSYLIKWTTGSFYFTSALVIAALGNQAIKETVPKAMFYCAGYLFATFTLCHAGQLLADETESLNNAIYNSNWYKQDVKLRKDMVFISMRCQKPVRSYTVPTGEYNYLAYTLVKTAYSYITLLNQI
ncbi:odorant receptor 85c-like isoform X2 [Rhynchophorus ferrugineus]|uniref:odorant receptor 85c-like isoform X2 n=1 Tax=Rhynchophorus ferrugineus TaxID=354439 RepID=UPI003FCDB549